MVTAPQLNSSDWSEHRIGNLIVAGEEIVWVIEPLELFPGHVSLRVMVPSNSNSNISMMTSVEGMELALTATATVHIQPTMWEDRPKSSVSLDITESLGMMK